LVAGYDEDTRFLLSWALYKAGYVVTEFCNSVDAMQLLHGDTDCADGPDFDLVVTDMPTPTVEVFDFLDLVGRGQPCPLVILLMEPDQAEIRERARQLGIATLANAARYGQIPRRSPATRTKRPICPIVARRSEVPQLDRVWDAG
jgi:CheY-like chemotaxis protein